MTERELRAVAEAIAENYGWKPDELYCGKPAYMNAISDAQAAISASDSKYVKGLVEALKFLKRMNETNNMWDNYPEAVCAIDDALQNLPEDLR